MKFTPIGNKLLIKIDANPSVIGGIIIPEAVKQKASEKATVVAVGPKVEQFKKGDRVMVSRHAGTDVVIDGVPHAVVPEEKILAVLK